MTVKNLIIKGIIRIGILGMVAAGLFDTGDQYTVSAIVTAPDEIVDEYGEAWEYTDIPFSEGTEVEVTFADRNTNDITNDIIIEIKRK